MLRKVSRLCGVGSSCRLQILVNSRIGTWWRGPSRSSIERKHQEFPLECRNVDYEQRIKAAYPIHPEIFDRLYTDWSTLVKFQRTRGVLRLMAAVIHSLWEKGDRHPLILPAHIAIDDPTRAI